MPADYAKRRRAIQRELRARGLDCLVVTHPANWYYLTGFTGEAGALIVTPTRTTLLTDGRFTVQAREEAPGIRVELQPGALYASLGAALKRERLYGSGYDPGQLTVSQLKALRKAAGPKWRGKAAGGLVEQLRMVKDTGEVAAMKHAAVLAGDVLEGVIKLIRPGVRESELGAEIEYQMKKRGASGASFPTIVASGWRAALPHARPTAKKLRRNELVVLDLGAILAHYCSDMTRTIYVGKASRRIREWYRSVQEAQAEAVASVREGVSCGEVDAAARDVLRKNGLDKYFVHSTGHGVGLEVHEDPRIARGQAVRLQAGNVITIEPGVYVEGVGGIRIEDDVVVRPRGPEVLTRVTRDLIEI